MTKSTITGFATGYRGLKKCKNYDCRVEILRTRNNDWSNKRICFTLKPDGKLAKLQLNESDTQQLIEQVVDWLNNEPKYPEDEDFECSMSPECPCDDCSKENMQMDRI